MIRKAVGAIVFQNDKYLLVHKTKINTNTGKETINGEWDFIKGGVKETDADLEQAVLREIKEETGSTDYKIMKQFNEKICFDFPEELKAKVGFDRQETTMFLVEFIGDVNSIRPLDNEISDFIFVEQEKVIEILTHFDTMDFFLKSI
ncbi:NUDIX domain-containing protein [Pseudoneobacillus sp. C159]